MDPTFLVALRVVSTVRKAIDSKQLRDRVTDIQTTVRTIERHLDEEVLVDLRTGFSRLATANETSNVDVARQERSAARDYFARLENRHAHSEVRGSSGALSGAQVIALAHFGNFHYFALCNDDRTALVHAYRCAESFPVLAVQLLPQEIFSKPYRSLIEEHRLDSAHTRAEQRRAVEEFRADRRRRVAQVLPGWAWTATKLAGVGIGGAIAACVMPPAGVGAFHLARQLTTEFEPIEPSALPTPLKANLGDQEAGTAALLSEMAREAGLRARELEGGGDRQRITKT